MSALSQDSIIERVAENLFPDIPKHRSQTLLLLTKSQTLQLEHVRRTL